MEGEEGLGVRRHVDVVLEVREERAVHHGLRVLLRRQLVALKKVLNVLIMNIDESQKEQRVLV